MAVIGVRAIDAVQGGIETYCRTVYPALVERGVDVIVFTRTPYDSRSVRRCGGVLVVPLRSLRSKRLETVVYSFFAVLAARRRSADIVQFHAIGPCLFVPLARALGMRTAVRHVGADYVRKRWGPLGRQVLRQAESLGMRRADAVFCVSAEIAEDVELRFGIRPSVIPNAVEVPAGGSGDATLRAWGLTKRRYLLAVGRVVPEKGFDRLIEAHSQLDPADRWPLVIVGDATHERRYRRQLERLVAAAPDVRMTGARFGSELAELFEHAGLFVLPSTHEGMSFALLEALAYGLPVLASDIPANRSLGLADDSYFEGVDAATLARSLEEHERLLDERGPRPRADRAPSVSLAEVVDRTLQVYATLLAAPPERQSRLAYR